MSTICGIFHIDGRPVSKEMWKEMMGKQCIYPMDDCGTWIGEGIFLGSSIKYITPESQKERLPYLDPSVDMVITADAIIDNREELFNLLNIPKNERQEIPDSRLILMAYIKWGEESPKYLVGDYTYAIWDNRRKEMFCARDHIGKQTLYFYYSDKTFIFSTLIDPILTVLENKDRLNKEWIAAFLSIEGVLHETDCNHTIYEEIMQLPPAHTIKINYKGIKKVRYWDPLDVPELRFKSDGEYEEAFREVFYEAVHCRLRSLGHVGVMLSGGLDSGSVAGVAAKELQRNDKRLKAYSAIPILEYKDWLPNRFIADESQYIKEYNQFYNNIDITYCRSEGKNSITNAKKFLNIFEQPYKTVENIYWVDDIVSIAAKGGCTVLLDGQFGNNTISYGDFLTHTVTLFKQLRWLSLFREINGYSNLHGLDSIRVAKIFAGKILKNSTFNLINKKSSNRCLSKVVPVNPEFAARYDINKHFRKAGFDTNMSKLQDISQVRKFLTSSLLFSHLGPFDTKLSLAYGIAKRDPTRDKRVVEFCMSLPGEQYVRNGQERYLIRRAMCGVLPESIRTNSTVRGKQSADWIQRLLPDWHEVKEELDKMLKCKEMEEYFDINKLNNVLLKLDDSIKNETLGVEVRMLIISLIFYYFISSKVF